MKNLIITLISLSAFANDPILTPATKESSGCNVKHSLGLEDKKDFLKFHSKLVGHIKEDKKTELASMINYPLRLSEKKVVKSKSEFIQNYDSIINKKIKRIILKQDQDSFFCKSTGLMYGRGEIWVNNFNKKSELRIISIFSK
ncbi:hypothetical protein [Halobacteriovorax sp. CON-3]|uniref:hypothetical protein n=1 Tax=Halobacteriovorax sp. CON-3 TaxID=3157710 RepID=UPI003721544E